MKFIDFKLERLNIINIGFSFNSYWWESTDLIPLSRILKSRGVGMFDMWIIRKLNRGYCFQIQQLSDKLTIVEKTSKFEASLKINH